MAKFSWRCRVAAALCAMVTATGCEESGDVSVVDPVEPAEIDAEANVETLPAILASKDEAGMFRWSSGQHMGQLWAGVENQSGNALRFFAPSEYSDQPDWNPEIEIADSSVQSIVAKGDTVNFVIGDEAFVIGYQWDDDAKVAELLKLGLSGHSTVLNLVSELANGDAEVVCTEFPQANYRTCFTTSGVEDAIW